MTWRKTKNSREKGPLCGTSGKITENSASAANERKAPKLTRCDGSWTIPKWLSRRSIGGPVDGRPWTHCGYALGLMSGAMGGVGQARMHGGSVGSFEIGEDRVKDALRSLFLRNFFQNHAIDREW